ncbi:hypothetical protein [Marmoricola sp. RAF53]|uniref:hypothetical protein n=1 Tax=Marmoricola sp. RAF53 TaxID=3233059 RepID=UPI003F997155
MNPSSVIAVTCSWRVDNTAAIDPIRQSDVRFNTTDLDFTYSPGAGSCSNDFDVEGILTHELGHVYGLADLYASADAELTMAGYGAACTAKARTLGWGDVRGLESIY